jgi:hypothetical protein
MDKKISYAMFAMSIVCLAVLLFNCRSPNRETPKPPNAAVSAPASATEHAETVDALQAEEDAMRILETDITTEPKRIAEELWSVHPLEPKLIGKWEDIDGRPLPVLEFVMAREGSRTPWNVMFQTEKLAGGCGFDAEMDAWCAVYDDSGKSVPRKVKTTIAILTNGGALRVAIDQLIKVDVRRSETSARK